MKLKLEEERTALQLMRVIPLFTGCPVEALTALVPYLDARDVPAGKVILMDQEIAQTLFLLISGQVGVWKRVGVEKKRLAGLEGPDFFGERSMFEESPASALIKSEEPCLLYALDRRNFLVVVEKFPAVVETIRQNMIKIREQRVGPPPKPAEGSS